MAARAINEREIHHRAGTDDSASRDEVSKKSGYRGLATPFVIEAYGGLGQCARGIIGKCCQAVAAASRPMRLLLGSPSRRLSTRDN